MLFNTDVTQQVSWISSNHEILPLVQAVHSELDAAFKCLKVSVLFSCFSFLFILNLASSQQNLEESSSSEDENENLTFNHKVCMKHSQALKGSTMPVKHSYKWRVCEMFCTCQLCAERQRMKQEKTVAQQAKREQLKRLHRAQVLFFLDSLIF